jgi:DNA-binding transcriptional LysR family regulator
LSQQIKALERDLGTRLFDRDRRTVRLTPAGEALLPRVQALLEQADDLRRAAVGLAEHEPVRVGCVNWCPPDLTSRITGVAQLLVDTWVLPSHTQASRVADGSIDLAICWIRSEDLETYGLEARLLSADRLYAVAPGRDTSPVRAWDTAVLVDADETSWLSWNIYAAEFLADTVRHPHAQRRRRNHRPSVLRPCTAASPPIGQLAQGTDDTNPAGPGPAADRRARAVLDLVPGLAPDREPVGCAGGAKAQTADRGNLTFDSGVAWLPCDDPNRPG